MNIKTYLAVMLCGTLAFSPFTLALTSEVACPAVSELKYANATTYSLKIRNQTWTTETQDAKQLFINIKFIKNHQGKVNVCNAISISNPECRKVDPRPKFNTKIKTCTYDMVLMITSRNGGKVTSTNTIMFGPLDVVIKLTK